MKKHRYQITVKCFVMIFTLIITSAHAEDDDLSPDTLPDEIPTGQSFVAPTVSEDADRSPQSAAVNTAPAEMKDEDAELEKPLTPLFPTEPQNLGPEDSERIKKVEVDEDLAKPDPSYVPPQPVMPVPTQSSTPSKDPIPAFTMKVKKLEQPNPAPLMPSEPVDAEPTPISVSSKPIPAEPKMAPRPPIVWAPEILKLMLADPSHLVPVETYIARLAVPPTTPSRPPKGVSDFSVILSNNEFYPSKIVLKTGSSVRLLFTTTNKKSAALVIERLNIQRWVASQSDKEKTKDLDRSKFEVNRELTANRVTEVEFQPKPGVYSFHDVITGASGEISVEEP